MESCHSTRDRLRPAAAGANCNNSSVDSVQEALREMTGGRGPDAVIEAVGMEGHGTGLQNVVDRAKQVVRASTDRATPLR